MTQKELNIVLEKHKKWLNGEDGGERADLSDANLSRANLSSAKLSYANLYGANLSYADLSGADLSGTDLSGADLRSANLSYADLSGTDLSGANLSYADLSNANLSYTNLHGAYLHSANLSSAKLSDANLYGANLGENEKIRLGVCLEEPMTGYKKCENGVIVTLRIPEGAIVFSINNSKCRANMAKVIDIDNGLTKATSCYDSKFIYRKGRIVRVKNFNCQYNEECASGIHFFRTREEAEKY